MRLADFDRDLERLEYPTTADAVASDYGDREIDLQEGTERLERLLGRAGPEVFASADELRLTLYGALPEAAIGRKGYSDRDPPGVGEGEPLSF